MKYYDFHQVRFFPSDFKPKPSGLNAIIEFAKYKRAHDENLMNGVNEMPSLVPVLDFTSMNSVRDFQGDTGGPRKGFYLTDKALRLLKDFDLPDHTIFPVTWSMFGKSHQCYYFYIHNTINNHISIENCLFKIQNTLPPYINYDRDIKFKNFEEYKAFKIPNYNTFKTIMFQELCLSKSTVFERDIFNSSHIYYPVSDIFFSEKLIKALNKSSLTGIRVLPKYIEVFKAI